MFQMIKSKRGTEKPIEIFIALFVILAVSLLVLRLFQSQISDTTDDLSTYQAEQQRNQLKNTFESECRSTCSAAQNDKGCSLESLAQVCIKNSKRILGATNDYIDLNKDNSINYDTEAYVGIGVCESNIPCFLEIPNCCGRDLNADACEQILTDLADERGQDVTDLYEATGFTEANYATCEVPAGDNVAWWDGVFTTTAAP